MSSDVSGAAASKIKELTREGGPNHADQNQFTHEGYLTKRAVVRMLE